MTFLSPTVLWGLAAASIPIIIHLLSLRHTRDVEFSTLRFIKELEHKTIRRLKLRQLLLVLLRILVIICLILMVARPVQKGFVPGWMAAEKETRVIIFVDNSASMSLVSDGITLLENAKESAMEIADSFEGQTRIDIYHTTPAKRVFNGKPGDTSLRNAVAAIPQTFSTDHLWVTVNSVLQNLKVKEPNRECFILSDIQSLPESESFLAEMRPDTARPQWRFYCLGQGVPKDNLSIRQVAAVSQIRLPNHLLKLNTNIVNDGTLDKRNHPVELFLNEKRLGQVVSTFQPIQSKEFMFQAYPGKSGLIKGRVELLEDDFAFDNVWTFELSIPEQIACTLVGQNAEEIFLLEMGLSSIDNQAGFLLLDSRVDPDPERLYLDETDVLILHNPGNLSDKAVEDIQTFLQRGGGMIWFAGDKQTEKLSLHAVTALKLPESKVLHKLSGEGYFSVIPAKKDYPILADLELRDIDRELPQVFSYLESVPQKNQNEILSLNNDHPFLLEFSSNGGQIYYFTSLMDLTWNDLPVRGLMVPLLHRILLLLATDEFNTKPVFVDEEKIISIDQEHMNSQWSLKTPSGKTILLIPDFNTESLKIIQTSEIGSYDVLSDEYPYTAFSVLLSPLEYPSKRVTKTEVLNTLPSGQAVWIDPVKNLSKELQNIRHGKSLWRTFLILAIILLFLETILGRARPASMKNGVE